MDLRGSILGLLVILALGVRHGLDPDHLATIDGMVLRAVERRSPLAPWIGTLFSLGHGSVIVAISLAICFFSGGIHLSPEVFGALEWLPIVILFVLGSVNLHALLRPAPFQIAGVRSKLLPGFLREVDHPLGIVAVGVIFALAFDTATQAAAWGMVAFRNGGVLGALTISGVFTVGMIATDTLDNLLVCRAISGRDGQLQSYRRAVGWLVVGLSFAMGSYAVLVKLFPRYDLSVGILTTIGATVFLLFLMLAWLARSARPQPSS